MSLFKVTVEKHAFLFLWEKYFSLSVIPTLLDSLMLGHSTIIAMSFEGKRQENILKEIKAQSSHHLSVK